MNFEDLLGKTIELSDITAWDREGNKLMVSKVWARALKADLEAKVQNILEFERDHQKTTIPYGMTATPEAIAFFTWDGSILNKVYTFSTPEILSTYDSEFSNKRISEFYLESLVEGWLRDLAFHWKLENPPKFQELEKIGFVQKLYDAVESGN